MTETPETQNPKKTDETQSGSRSEPASETRDGATPDEIEAIAFAPGWEKEHGVDYSSYLDALLDKDHPLHETTVKSSKAEQKPNSPDSERANP